MRVFCFLVAMLWASSAFAQVDVNEMLDNAGLTEELNPDRTKTQAYQDSLYNFRLQQSVFYLDIGISPIDYGFTLADGGIWYKLVHCSGYMTHKRITDPAFINSTWAEPYPQAPIENMYYRLADSSEVHQLASVEKVFKGQFVTGWQGDVIDYQALPPRQEIYVINSTGVVGWFRGSASARPEDNSLHAILIWRKP